MGEKTSIGWVGPDGKTFNIVWGCVEVSPACDNCYARVSAKRWGFAVWGAKAQHRTFGENYWNEPRKWNAKAAAVGVRRSVFCSSMCDIFENHPTTRAELRKLWPLIRETPALDWLLLTKRPERIRQSLPSDWGNGYPNVRLGTTVENEKYGRIRIRHLVKIRAYCHFLSFEPMLGSVGEIDLQHIEWVPAANPGRTRAR